VDVWGNDFGRTPSFVCPDPQSTMKESISHKSNPCQSAGAAVLENGPMPTDDSPPHGNGTSEMMECSPEINEIGGSVTAMSSEDVEGSLPSQSSSKRSSAKDFPRSVKRASLTSIGEYSTAGSLATQRKSSLEMRRMPVDVLLQPSNLQHDTTSVLSEDADEDGLSKREESEKETDCLRFLCLRPNYTLRKQMMLSFGSINLITIAVVVSVCVVLSLSAGENVKSASSYTLDQLAKQSLGYRSRYLAEALTESIILLDTVKFLHQATQDRFEGHPNPTDEHVPFFDINSGTNIYPVRGPAMPLEWDISPNVNESNFEEHLQSRQKLYENRPVDTRTAGFFMQGACNPLETNTSGDAYWPNCTTANNDIATGGVVVPSNQTELYYRKGGDMVPILRAVFEQYDVIGEVGLYFLNNGAGATIIYPQYIVSTQSTYVSTGCDWLLASNPYDPSRTIGTEEMAKKCRKEGEEVSSRLYNPMERGWCRDQASNPHKIFIDAFEDAFNPGTWILVLGRSIYDRMTQEFIACMFIGINLDKINELLENSRTSQRAEATVIHFDDHGYVVASSKNFTGEGRVPIYDANLGLTRESYDDLTELVDFDSRWDPVESRLAFESFSTSDSDFFVSVHPMPPIPDVYDAEYRPVFFVVTSLHLEDRYEAINALNDRIDDRVSNIITFAWICGLVGLVIATVIIFAMARMLTSPLTNMNKVANEIVGSFGDSRKEDEIRKSGDVSLETNCSPRTELRDVVTEFNTMVTNFSGASEAKSEKFRDEDMENNFPARQDLLDLYKSRVDALFRFDATGEHAECDTDERDGNSSGEVVSIPSIAYLHFGPNYTSSKPPSFKRLSGNESPTTRSRWTALFLWIVVLIATPLLFITILVSAGVIMKINIEFARSTNDIQVDYLNLQEQAILSYARLRAEFVSSYTQKFTNDLFLLARYSSWLIFGGLNSTGSFTEMTSGIEVCKDYADDYSQCPYVQENFVCDCRWKENGYDDVCEAFANASTSRRLQRMNWISEFSNTTDGDRFGTSFPIEHYSPQSGRWWNNLSGLPGSQDAFSISRHDTTYERIRSFSAIPVTQPLFNYNRGEGRETTLGLGIGFEEDGTFISYEGCFSSYHVTLSSWSSTVENNAEKIRPELCPVGKFGFDPR
jgi:hypothetical protein